MTVPTDSRLRKAVRNQVELVQAALDDLIPDSHPVRGIWALVSKRDLSPFYAEIEARGSEPGRAPTDPRILLTLWVQALSEGIGSARMLARLCERDVIYRWICGGVSLNYHTLSDFRTKHGAAFDELVAQTVAMLMRAGVVTLRAAAQDGMRVRASAGAASFRREETLERCLEEARIEVARLRKELDEGGDDSIARREAARVRAAREQEEKLEAALREMAKVKEQRAQQEKRDRKRAAKRSSPRVSTTDPEARVMKMADGGFRPAFNVQFVTDVDGGCIVGVGVTNEGTDNNQIEPLLADVLDRTGKVPERYLVDGGFANEANIEALAACGIEPLAPVKKPKKKGVDPYAPKPSDSPEVCEWRARMATDEAKEAYRERAQTAERVNADMRNNRAMTRFLVRGLPKVTSVVLLSALAFNIGRIIALGLV
jgi:transposase